MIDSPRSAEKQAAMDRARRIVEENDEAGSLEYVREGLGKVAESDKFAADVSGRRI